MSRGEAALNASFLYNFLVSPRSIPFKTPAFRPWHIVCSGYLQIAGECRMILSSDELEILEYLKSWKGTPVSMVEICRCAGGRKKYRECPHWAKGLMSRLVESNMVEVNERGHYRVLAEDEPKEQTPAAKPTTKAKPVAKEAHTVGDDYFPGADTPQSVESTVVDGDYFPSEDIGSSNTEYWVSPQLAEILKKSGKKFKQKT
jgi:hypothetical protein